ncbi:hypothetical protein SAMN02583745_00732 [Thorsellia anophelis DSM 18579]|uniref:Uncharacterized protein n=1 Tax=Thorsellia anophelis DSM 18579 TaxID=1123402 RepID=A0A1H9ZW07_9GAMM|nr:hypothetical protein SAMN02583745_00732 [Thorsellia anophelis DSM 18579]
MYYHLPCIIDYSYFIHEKILAMHLLVIDTTLHIINPISYINRMIADIIKERQHFQPNLTVPKMQVILIYEQFNHAFTH